MKKLLFLLFTAALLCACNGVDKISFKGVENIDFVPWNSLTVDVAVDNKLRSNVNVDDIYATIYFDRRKIGTMTLNEGVVIRKRAMQVVSVPMTITLTNPFAAVGLLSDVDGSLEKITFDVTCKCRIKGVSRSIGRQNVALSKFISNFEELNDL